MKSIRRDTLFTRLLSDYGMLLVLALLCVLFSLLTIKEQTSTGSAGAKLLFERISKEPQADGRILIVAGSSEPEKEFADSLHRLLESAGYRSEEVTGSPMELRAWIA